MYTKDKDFTPAAIMPKRGKHSIVEQAGSIAHFYNGKPHREDGPAIVYTSGTKMWYKHGKRHREDGPAIVYPDGEQRWFKNDKLHREDGPAIIFSSGSQGWYQNNKRHREDGPAFENETMMCWFLNDKELSFDQFCKRLKLTNEQKLVLALRYNP